MLTDGQMDSHDEANSCFRKFVTASKNGTIHLVLDNAHHHIQETVIDTYRM